jgi:predicted RNA-binding protein YlxR (DUF448 family)
VTCRQLLDRQQLWRVVRLKDGGLSLDHGMGRSAYLCPTQACLEQAKRRKKLQKGLRCQVADSIYAALEQRLNTTPVAGSEAR